VERSLSIGTQLKTAKFSFYKLEGEDWVTTQRIDKAHQDTIWSGAFSGGDNPRLVTCGADRAIKVGVFQRIIVMGCVIYYDAVQVWEESTSEPSEEDDGSKQWRLVAEYTIADTQWPLYSISWSQQNGLIAVGGGDRLLR